MHINPIRGKIQTETGGDENKFLENVLMRKFGSGQVPYRRHNYQQALTIQHKTDLENILKYFMKCKKRAVLNLLSFCGVLGVGIVHFLYQSNTSEHGAFGSGRCNRKQGATALNIEPVPIAHILARAMLPSCCFDYNKHSSYL